MSGKIVNMITQRIMQRAKGEIILKIALVGISLATPPVLVGRP